MKSKTDTNLCYEDTPQKSPDDISKVQQYHVFKEQRRQSKFGNKVSQTFRLVLGDEICPKQIHANILYSIRRLSFDSSAPQSILPASYVAAQNDSKALEKSWEKLVDGHGTHISGARQGIMGYVLSMDEHKVAG